MPRAIREAREKRGEGGATPKPRKVRKVTSTEERQESEIDSEYESNDEDAQEKISIRMLEKDLKARKDKLQKKGIMRVKAKKAHDEELRGIIDTDQEEEEVRVLSKSTTDQLLPMVEAFSEVLDKKLGGNKVKRVRMVKRLEEEEANRLAEEVSWRKF